MPGPFFTSDTHFNHIGIIDHCKRPFASVEEMNEALIANWNAVVGEWDEVFHLGDFCWHEKGMLAIFERLNGVKHLIAGNHDHKRTRRLPWASVQYAHRIKVPGLPRFRVYLSHYRVNGFRETLHFHGHEHNPKPSERSRVVDVGVDAWGYRPVSLKQAIEAAQQ